jgi:hypothetical protein
MIRFGGFKYLVAASLLAASAGSAEATTYYTLVPGVNSYGTADTYETSASYSALNNYTTSSFGGSSAKGGLCVYLTANCTTNPLAGRQGALTGSNPAYITLTMPMNLPLANYLLQVQVTGLSTTTGDIYTVYVNGANLGTTPYTAPAGQSSEGQLSGVIALSASSIVNISVVDLLQQLQGASASQYSAFCTSLSGSGCGSITTGISAGYDPSSLLTLAVDLQTDPEPATLSMFAGSAALLGVLRRRRAKSKA